MATSNIIFQFRLPNFTNLFFCFENMIFLFILFFIIFFFLLRKTFRSESDYNWKILSKDFNIIFFLFLDFLYRTKKIFKMKRPIPSEIKIYIYIYIYI